MSNLLFHLANPQVQVRLRIQLNTILFAKTLVRKDVASATVPKMGTDTDDDAKKSDEEGGEDADDADFTSKAQVMTLMTTDVDRVSEFTWHLYSLIGL